MVIGRSRLRVYVPAVILCTILLWHFRAGDYGRAYLKAGKATLDKSLGAELNNDSEQEVEKTTAFFDTDINVQVLTPPIDTKTSDPALIQETRLAQADEDDTSKYHDEEEKYKEEMAKYEDHHKEMTENTESGIFLDKSKQSGKSRKIQETGHELHQKPSSDEVDWSRFAYTQYVTNEEYLCNSVMIFETLHRLGSKADRVMMYPSVMLKPDAKDSLTREGKLLINARDKYNVELIPIKVQRRQSSDPTWADSFTKLLAFNQTQYDRVLSLDSDGTILQTMDELFLLPPCPVAMPRAYWLLNEDPATHVLSSQVMLIQPDHVEFQRIMEKIKSPTGNEYDMEIVNDLYRDSAMVLPHRPYNMLTGEWRRGEHSHYLGSDREKWDPTTVLKEAKFLHFSDWPVPKPWIKAPWELIQRNQPPCNLVDGKKSCVEREIWNKFYSDFAEQRRSVCGFELVEEDDI